MAGSITVTTSEYIGTSLIKTTIAWTSDASGNVNGLTFPMRRGFLRQVKFVPGSGGSAPTDLYDITITDPDGIDVLIGTGETGIVVVS
jgi:hypothetical protein